jgi:hypothetical protein
MVISLRNFLDDLKLADLYDAEVANRREYARKRYNGYGMGEYARKRYNGYGMGEYAHNPYNGNGMGEYARKRKNG